MKTAIVHDWLYSISGAEKVVEAIYNLYPSYVYTLVKNQKYCSSSIIPNEKIICSFIQKLPFGKTKYPFYLPLFPLAIENLDVSDADVVISSSSCVAKGVLTNSDQLHICYCHTPARFAWDMYFEYLKLNKVEKGLLSFPSKYLLHQIRNWDLLHSSRVDHYIANSYYVAKRIERLYRRSSEVIYPPVDTDFYSSLSTKKDEGFYLAASRCVPYKRLDLIIDAFKKLKDRKLVVVGGGPLLKKLRAKAPRNVEFTGYIEKHLLRKYLNEAKAFVFAGKEDFGILPVEAQAVGLPVIAFGKGGVKETVIENKTGVFFNTQSAESLISAIIKFENQSKYFDPEFIKKHASQFSKSVFERHFKDFVESRYRDFKK